MEVENLNKSQEQESSDKKNDEPKTIIGNPREPDYIRNLPDKFDVNAMIKKNKGDKACFYCKNDFSKLGGKFMKAKKTKSRWITIFKHYPQIMMGEKNIWLLSEDD